MKTPKLMIIILALVSIIVHNVASHRSRKYFAAISRIVKHNFGGDHKEEKAITNSRRHSTEYGN